MNYKKTSALTGLLVGATGLLMPLSEAGANGLPPPDHYCPITGIPVNGSCTLSGPTHIRLADEPGRTPVRPRKYDASGGVNNAGSGTGNMSRGTGNAGVHGGAANSNRGS
ncbi:hypothetical protein [Segniliparus rugosus]|uniref:Intersectin-EH binding protein Ibp1 n=1 Tax=Segniliparus rugosus (strain ATCC BAA-974 / DSM 45345 / CCUG 50838 / CIP 108380 / JCM 13579 / CDC 945) TaxID=679197 RepID=E5XM32_SEGRC|nr:hypothetical protein [Segniliparus rugosus]EFV14593.1 hypothetical protein HMPREF9336_00551 [Segniliparus rugosus ATCC BAA-974]